MFTNPNDYIWFGNGVLKTKNEDDIKNISRSSLFQPTLGVKIFKGWFLMTLEIILSLGRRYVKKFKSELNKLKKCHCVVGKGEGHPVVLRLVTMQWTEEESRGSKG